VVTVVGAVVGIATLVKLAQLSQGGAKIAEMLGGRPIDPATRDPKERELLNIVEEMSIASGVPVPPVYLLDDHSVNAFAAGPDPSRSVIGVTRGCIDLLSRDELQGVIAHEYSHIFHGDTRINARTTAVIAGIMAVGVIGYIMFRFVGPTLARTSGRGKNNPGPALGFAIIVAGLLIWAIGSIGMLFGRMIQAAISRQREFLADASAVQYTRNPDGIGGALTKIRDHVATTRIESPAASELNHFFFCSSLNTLFATHPPIDDRIKRIVGMGAMKVAVQEARRTAIPAGNSPMPRMSKSTGKSTAPHASAMPVAGFTDADSSSATLAGAGTLDPAAISRARAWKNALPSDLADATQTADGARALCYAIARRSAAHEECDRIVANSDPKAYALYGTIAVQIAQLRPDMQIALAELAAPVLFRLGPQNYASFREILAQAIRSDSKTDLREWSLLKCLERNVERRFANAPARANGALMNYESEARTVIAVIASATHAEPVASSAYANAASTLNMRATEMPASSTRTLDALSGAVKTLATLTFTDRQRLLEACATAAAHDGRISVDEYLVIRSVADALDVPMPALI
jgi:Zn-dependent protease with chaperone function